MTGIYKNLVFIIDTEYEKKSIKPKETKDWDISVNQKDVVESTTLASKLITMTKEANQQSPIATKKQKIPESVFTSQTEALQFQQKYFERNNSEGDSDFSDVTIGQVFLTKQTSKQQTVEADEVMLHKTEKTPKVVEQKIKTDKKSFEQRNKSVIKKITFTSKDDMDKNKHEKQPIMQEKETPFLDKKKQTLSIIDQPKSLKTEVAEAGGSVDEIKSKLQVTEIDGTLRLAPSERDVKKEASANEKSRKDFTPIEVAVKKEAENVEQIKPELQAIQEVASKERIVNAKKKPLQAKILKAEIPVEDEIKTKAEKSIKVKPDKDELSSAIITTKDEYTSKPSKSNDEDMYEQSKSYDEFKNHSLEVMDKSNKKESVKMRMSIKKEKLLTRLDEATQKQSEITRSDHITTNRKADKKVKSNISKIIEESKESSVEDRGKMHLKFSAKLHAEQKVEKKESVTKSVSEVDGKPIEESRPKALLLKSKQSNEQVEVSQSFEGKLLTSTSKDLERFKESLAETSVTSTSQEQKPLHEFLLKKSVNIIESKLAPQAAYEKDVQESKQSEVTHTEKLEKVKPDKVLTPSIIDKPAELRSMTPDVGLETVDRKVVLDEPKTMTKKCELPSHVSSHHQVTSFNDS